MCKQVTRQELIDILDKTDADRLVVTIYREIKMNKTGNPFYQKVGRAYEPMFKVEKKTKASYLYGGNYKERVDEALKADGSANADFQTEGLRWGKWWIKDKVIEHNGSFYIRTYLDRDGLPKSSEYFVDGVPATEEQLKDIKAFEICDSFCGSKKQLEEGLSADKQVIPNNIKFENIQEIEIGGETYKIAL